MELQSLECRCFRCLSSVVFTPGPGMNVVRGGNAQGKTSLLEAVLYAATSKSHRTNQESELAQRGEEGFQVRAAGRRAAGEVRIEANWWRGAKRFKVNGVAQHRMSELLGRFNVVFFSPEDVGLVQESAARRRRFMDMELAQLDPAYLAALQQYRQALRQRNELMRRHNADPDQAAVWEAQLAAHGATLIRGRAAFVAELAEHAAAAYARIADGEALGLAYRPDLDASVDLAGSWARDRARDAKRGVTGRGPHRDDIEVLVAGQPARTFASQGQQKSAALALKLAELELVKARIGEYPVLMLDEVLAELDADRARRLFETVDPSVQMLVTTTERAVAAERFRRPHRNFVMEQGRLEEA